MPVITSCPDCDLPIFASVGPAGAYLPHECETCGHRMVIEMSRLGGTTYPEEMFIEEVLPGLDVERCDHPVIEDDYIYADPERIKFRHPETGEVLEG